MEKVSEITVMFGHVQCSPSYAATLEVWKVWPHRRSSRWSGINYALT